MDLIEYLGALPPVHIERLYDSQPCTCLAVFRSLPALEKQYVYRFLFCSADEGVPIEIVSSWTTTSRVSRHHACLEVLSRLRIVVRSDRGSYMIHAGFQRHIQNALSCGIHNLFKELPDIPVLEQDVLDAFAWDQWEKVLMYAISPQSEFERLKGVGGKVMDLKSIMLACGIIAEYKGTKEASITASGFQFLLSDTHKQVWIILTHYIKHAENHKSRDLFDKLIEFLLQLGFRRECIPSAEFTAEQQEISSDLCHMGLLYPFKHEGVVYLVPTKLSVMLSGQSSSVAQEDGFIIVETNYRVYAYTASPLKQSILRLFIRCDALLPNLVVGTITRESVMSALDSGITAEQIIGYLTQHAHKRVATRVPIVPGVVVDQIRLWQREIQRMQFQPAVLYKNFETPQLYKQVLEFSDGLGSTIMSDDAKQELLAISSFHSQIRDQIKLFKQDM